MQVDAIFAPNVSFRRGMWQCRLARALSVVVNIVDPQVIVLGGGVSNIDHIYDAVPRRWKSFVFSDSVDTQLVRAKHGDSSGVRGAAWLWPEEQERTEQ